MIGHIVLLIIAVLEILIFWGVIIYGICKLYQIRRKYVKRNSGSSERDSCGTEESE